LSKAKLEHMCKIIGMNQLNIERECETININWFGT
jgi:hypothetical protein